MIEKRLHFRLGLPHTNYQGSAEHLMMAWLGAYAWDNLAESIGVGLDALRDATGKPVYATFFFIESRCEPDSVYRRWKLDEEVELGVRSATYKNLLMDSFLELKGPAGKTASFRMCNILITPKGGQNTALKIVAPVNGDFSRIATLGAKESPFRLNREYTETKTLGVLPNPLTPPARAKTWELVLNPERDTNGAGLVYFAHYFVYLNMALRDFLGIATRDLLPNPLVRRIIFLGNAEPDERIRVETRDHGQGFVSQMLTRAGDGSPIAYTELKLDSLDTTRD